MGIREVQDEIENLGFRVAFVHEFFAQPRGREMPEFSEAGLSGLCLILQDIEDGLDRMCTELQQIQGQEGN